MKKLSPQATLQTIKMQFPDVQFWMFVGRSPGKRIKGQMFLQNTAVPVWDRRTQILMKRLPYMRKVEEADLGFDPEKTRKTDVVIPENWRDLHHMRRIALAKQLSNGDIRSVAQADEIIAQNAPKPAAPPPPPPEPVTAEPEAPAANG